jgi:hypothetical protein
MSTKSALRADLEAGRRAQMIKMRLGGSNDFLEPFPQKPRGMHWRPA